MYVRERGIFFHIFFKPQNFLFSSGTLAPPRSYTAMSSMDARGDTKELAAMLSSLMHSPQGAELMRRLNDAARK